MKGFVAAAVFVLASTLLTTSALAQATVDQRLGVDPRTGTAPVPPGPERPYPPLVLPEVGKETLAREDRVLKKGLLAPSIDDRMTFAAFLRTRNTGLIRLLPRELYDSGTYRVEKKLNIRGGGAYYSFAHLTHAYGYGSDVSLERNHLSVGFAGADYGMLTNVGDVPLDQITLDDKRTQNIAAYRPPRSETEARREYRRLDAHKGMTFDGFRYTKRVPVQENTTYLLRSISYDNSDVLVAFRLVREDANGSVIIAWKLLKNYPKPELARNTTDQ